MTVWKTPDQVETQVSLNAVPCARISDNGHIAHTISIDMEDAQNSQSAENIFKMFSL